MATDNEMVFIQPDSGIIGMRTSDMGGSNGQSETGNPGQTEHQPEAPGPGSDNGEGDSR